MLVVAAPHASQVIRLQRYVLLLAAERVLLGHKQLPTTVLVSKAERQRSIRLIF